MRYNQPCVCGRSSSGRARPCQGRGSEFEPRRPLQKKTPSERLGSSFGICQRGSLNSLPRPARSASNPEVRQGSCEWLCHSWDAGSESSLVARSKKERHPCGCLSFLEQHFCYAKVVACGRVIEREWGNPQRFPPHAPPSLRWVGVRFFVSDESLSLPKVMKGYSAPRRGSLLAAAPKVTKRAA